MRSCLIWSIHILTLSENDKIFPCRLCLSRLDFCSLLVNFCRFCSRCARICSWSLLIRCFMVDVCTWLVLRQLPCSQVNPTIITFQFAELMSTFFIWIPVFFKIRNENNFDFLLILEKWSKYFMLECWFLRSNLLLIPITWSH